MKHVHNKKIDETEIKTMETSDRKRLANKTIKSSSKKTISIIIILFVFNLLLLEYPITLLE